MLEKHFTLDKGLPGPDHRFSSDPAEFRELAASVRTMEKSLGRSELGPASSEELGRRNYRLSCVAASELSAGHHLTVADVAFRRPGVGLPPKAVDGLINRELLRDVPSGHVFSVEDFA